MSVNTTPPFVTAGTVTSASRMNLLADGIQAAWTAFTPTLGNITIGNGTVTGKWFQQGKIIKGHVEIVAGSTTTYGTGTLTVGALPVAAAASYVLNGSPAGPAFMHNGSSATRNIGLAILTSTTSVFFVYGSAAGATVTNTAPFTFGTASVLTFTFEYEAA